MGPSPQLPTKWLGVSDRGRVLEIISPLFFGLSFVAVSLRLYARLSSIRKLLADDYFCIIAQIFGFGLMASIIVLAEKGAIGWHFVEIPQDQALVFFKAYLAGEVLYTTVVASYKLAIVFLYRNIFGEIRSFNIISWVLIGITGSWYVAGVFATMFQCLPAQKSWDPYVDGVCFNQDAYVLAFSLINMALDVIILILPLPLVWKLNLSTAKKVALSAMFLLGIIVCIASILRITSSFPIDFIDPTYSLFQVTMWSQIEPAIGIIAACLPTLRQLFVRSFPGRSKYNQERTYSSKHTVDSNSKSQTAVALTGWNANSAYVEVGSAVVTPTASRHPDVEANNHSDEDGPTSFLDFMRGEPTIQGEDVESKSILVSKKVSVTTE